MALLQNICLEIAVWYNISCVSPSVTQLRQMEQQQIILVQQQEQQQLILVQQQEQQAAADAEARRLEEERRQVELRRLMAKKEQVVKKEVKKKVTTSRSLLELHALRLRLESAESLLSQHICLICLGEDGVHECGVRIMQLEVLTQTHKYKRIKSILFTKYLLLIIITLSVFVCMFACSPCSMI